MKKRFILIGFTSYSKLKLLDKANQINAGMTGNDNFPAPSPTLKVLQAAIGAYGDALSQPNSLAATAKRSECRADLIDVLTSLGAYVQSNSNNDVAIMLSSGYSVNKLRSKVGALPVPKNLRVMPQPNGAIRLKVVAVPGAKSYLFEYALITGNVPGEWQTCPSSKSNTVINDLVSGSEYNFRVAAVGAVQGLAYSKVVNSFVL